MSLRLKRAVAWLPLVVMPLAVLGSSNVGCELLVDVNPMLVDGSPGDVIFPTTLDGFNCHICTDVSSDADFDGDEAFPTHEPKDSAVEATSRDAAAETTGDDGGSGEGGDAGAG